MKEIETHICHGGTLSVYEHDSDTLDCVMKFSVFMPPQAKDGKVPVVTFLSGLTCTHENFTTKAAAYKQAADSGVAVIAPDTSPRGENVPDDDAYDFGQGAGFYINAMQEPWTQHFQMERYITEELNQLVAKECAIDPDRQGICGHSMGGHGALTFYLKYPDLYKSVSALAPIVAPSQVPWGQKAFAGYLGDDKAEWAKHDATALMNAAAGRDDCLPILIDQGGDDQFLKEQLKPELFVAACEQAGQAVSLNIRPGYDHSYYFIQSFIDDHIVHHARLLTA